MFAPFGVRNYRLQWFSDLFASFATEMEITVLGWFVIVETGSVSLLALFASLQYLGTLIAPMLGLGGDRFGQRSVLLAFRLAYAFLAFVIVTLALTGSLSAITALVVAGAAGMMRPTDLGMRNVLINQSVDGSQLMAAISLSRMTMDTARIAGALAGASIIAALGLATTYIVIAVLYGLSCLALTLMRNGAPKWRGGQARFAPFADLLTGLRALIETPGHLASMLLAFLVNLTAYPFTLGLLPYLARDVYRADQIALGYLTAATGVGAMCGSLVLGYLGSRVRPARLMLLSGLIWHGLILILGQTSTVSYGLVVLGLIGGCSMLCLLPLSVLLLKGVAPELLGRVMGIRMQAVYGLPLGLMISGPLIERYGFSSTSALYGLVGLTGITLLGWKWFSHLWPAGADSNRG